VKVRTAVLVATQPDDEGYIGLAVHTASRLCAAAHGGQVLVSGDTKAAMAGSTDTAFVRLGRFRLRGLPDATEVFQVGSPGLPAEFPPLRSAVAKPVGRRPRG
jgi:class 3 adenylate cyclase